MKRWCARSGGPPGAVCGLAFAAILAVGCGERAGGAVDLEQALPAGRAPNWYAQQLESSGYEVTSINYERGDYLEYEVVKGSESYEVRLEIDRETDTVGRVAVVDNLWKTTNTNQALQQNQATIVVPSGTRIAVKLNDYLDSGENHEGDTFTMSVAEPVAVDGETVIPSGTRINGYVASVESARRPNKGGRLVLKANAMEVNGDEVRFEAVVTAETGDEGESSIRQDWKEIVGGAGVGGLVGGLIGGGKGVLTGVLVGGGGMFLATKGEQIELHPDTELIVELREPVRVSH